jgi:hypothetical protein
VRHHRHRSLINDYNMTETTIVIESPFDKEAFIRANAMRWRIAGISIRQQIILYGVGMLLFLSWGLYQYQQTSKFNTMMILGIFFFFVESQLVFNRLYRKGMYDSAINREADKFEAMQTTIRYELDDDSFRYWDDEKHLEYKWSVFTEYSFYRNYLVLWMSKSADHIILFDVEDPSLGKGTAQKMIALVKERIATYKELSENKKKAGESDILDS